MNTTPQLAYDSSHFCPLLPMEEGDAFVPLVDCMLASLPVRFAYDPDLPDPQPVKDLVERLVARIGGGGGGEHDSVDQFLT